ncbi:MAG TPA: Holliday junction resolvase RuvX [Candidatus Nanopelagicaceae bacterium]|nr:Holliday junction resolvase RuvX [Candidatus Nanopelagicaceae bacterium]
MLPSGRRLAIDFGDVRIGLAVSDTTALVASPLRTIKNSDDNVVAVNEEIASIVLDEAISVVYIGLPIHLSGGEGTSAEKVRHFAQELRSYIGSHIEMRLVDERLSTKSAISQAKSIGKKLTREDVDQMAAVAILEFALQWESSSGRLAGDEI